MFLLFMAMSFGFTLLKTKNVRCLRRLCEDSTQNNVHLFRLARKIWTVMNSHFCGIYSCSFTCILQVLKHKNSRRMHFVNFKIEMHIIMQT